MAKKKNGGVRPDLATFGGLVLALAGMLGGLLLEGGKIQDVSQLTAAMIVFAGTFGAVMVSTPLATLKAAIKSFAHVFTESLEGPDALIEEIITYATKARKSGLVSLEDDAMRVADPFLRKALNLAVDGTDMQELRAMMQLEMDVVDGRANGEVRVFESAGGYAPTIGIIGAVMGLIQVMKNLANIEEVGHGIAVAFVATVYGVASANLLFLPAASKMRARVRQKAELRELMLEGVISIVEGLNPKLIRNKLEAFKPAGSPASKKGQEDQSVETEPATAAAGD